MIVQTTNTTWSFNHRDFSEPTPKDSYALKALAINHLREAGFLINQQQVALIDASTPQQLKAGLIAAGVLPVNPEAVLNYALTRAIEANNPSVTTLISLGANPLTHAADGSHFMHAMCNQHQMTDSELAHYLLHFFAQPGTYAFSMLFENSGGKPSPIQNACTRRSEFMETFHKMLVGDQDKDIAHKKTLLGLIYKHHEPKTLERLRLALSLFRSAASQKDKNAQLELAKMYLNTKEQNPDMLNTALELLKEAAEAGFPEAQFVQARIYMRETASEESKQEGLKLMKLAASQGHPLAKKTAIEQAIKKGLVMLERTNNRQDALTIAKAEFHYAANKKNAIGQFVLGKLFVEHATCSRDYIEGYQWLQLALNNPQNSEKDQMEFQSRVAFLLTQYQGQFNIKNIEQEIINLLVAASESPKASEIQKAKFNFVLAKYYLAPTPDNPVFDIEKGLSRARHSFQGGVQHGGLKPQHITELSRLILQHTTPETKLV